MQRRNLFLLSAVTSIGLWMVGACAPQEFKSKQDAVPTKDLIAVQCLNGTAKCDGSQITQTITVPNQDKKVDILFVVDNSRSMQAEQANMASKFPNFIQSLQASNWDYRIAIVTTDMAGSGPLKGGNLVDFKGSVPAGTQYITKNTPGAVDGFQQTVQMTVDASTYGSGDERPIFAAITAIRRNQNNWMRDDANIAVVIISDEDERSDGGATYGSPLISGQDFPADLMANIPAGKKLTTHAIAIRPGDSICLNDQRAQFSLGTSGDGNYANVISTLVQITGGVVPIGTVCANDYGAQLGQIAQAINQTTKSSEALTCAPVGGNVNINSMTPFVSTVISTNGTVAQFTPALAPGTTLTVQYQCP